MRAKKISIYIPDWFDADSLQWVSKASGSHKYQRRQRANYLISHLMRNEEESPLYSLLLQKLIGSDYAALLEELTDKGYISPVLYDNRYRYGGGQSTQYGLSKAVNEVQEVEFGGRILAKIKALHKSKKLKLKLKEQILNFND